MDTRSKAAGNAGEFGEAEDDMVVGQVGDVQGAVEWKEGVTGDGAEVDVFDGNEGGRGGLGKQRRPSSTRCVWGEVDCVWCVPRVCTCTSYLATSCW